MTALADNQLSPVLFGATKIIESVYMVEDGEPYDVKRKWMERLFSLPWKPLKSYKTVILRVPIQSAFKMPGDIYVMHPEIANLLRNSCREMI